MESQEEKKEIGIGQTAPTDLLTFIQEGVEVIKVNSIFNELPDIKKIEILKTLTSWINKQLDEL